MTISRRLAGDAFTVSVLFLATQALTTLFIDSMSPETIVQGSPMMQFIWSGIYVVVLFRAYRVRYRLYQALRANPVLVALMGVTLLSALWSAAPQITFRRSIATVLSTLFAADMSVRYSVREQIALTSTAVGASIVLSAIAELLFSGFVPTATFGNALVDPSIWHGLFPHKNGFGHVLAFGSLCVMAQRRRSVVSYLVGAACLVGILVLTAEAQSRTALLISITMILTWPLLNIVAWPRATLSTLGVSIGLVALTLVYAGISMAGHLAELLGRDPDMTGRTEIWSLAMQSVARHPLLGYGISGFWSVADDSLRIRSIIGWDTPYAHNGYIDTALQLGLIGLALLIGMILLAIVRQMQQLRRSPDTETKWPLMVILFSLLYSLTETDFLYTNWIFWILLVTAVCLSGLTQPQEQRNEIRMGLTGAMAGVSQ